MLNMTEFKKKGEGQKLTSAKYGFTLAEVLITLSIIGIVSALTLPNVLGNYRNKTYVAQLQRFYNQMTNAASQYLYDCDTDTLADTNIGTEAGADAFIKKYFKVTKVCDTATDCFGDTYKKAPNSQETTSPDDMFITTVGKIYNLNTGATIGWSEGGFNNGSIVLYLDVNGQNGPNIAGRDFFGLKLHENGDLTDIAQSIDSDNRAACLSGGYSSCFDTIVKEGWVMDY